MFSKAARWLGKILAVDCPHCGQRIELKHEGELDGVSTSQKARRRSVYLNYTQILSELSIGESFAVPPRRMAHFSSQSGPWLRAHPFASLSEEKLPDGSIRFTRTA